MPVFKFKTRLRFIGENGSMGLTHGQIYMATVSYGAPYIWVRWKWNEGERPTSDRAADCCPYASIAALGHNWELASIQNGGN